MRPMGTPACNHSHPQPNEPLNFEPIVRLLASAPLLTATFCATAPPDHNKDLKITTSARHHLACVIAAASARTDVDPAAHGAAPRHIKGRYAPSLLLSLRTQVTRGGGLWTLKAQGPSEVASWLHREVQGDISSFMPCSDSIQLEPFLLLCLFMCSVVSETMRSLL